MPRGYVILTEAINDEAGMKAYGQASAPSLASGGGTVLSVETKPRILEGDWHGDRTVVLEFESVEAAHAWYESDEYQEAKLLRENAAQSNAVILSGFEMPRRHA